MTSWSSTSGARKTTTSPRVGVLYAPERLAEVVYTCFVKADTSRVLYRKPVAKAAEESATDAAA
jgi:hypothetical protein